MRSDGYNDSAGRAPDWSNDRQGLCKQDSSYRHNYLLCELWMIVKILSEVVERGKAAVRKSTSCYTPNKTTRVVSLNWSWACPELGCVETFAVQYTIWLLEESRDGKMVSSRSSQRSICSIFAAMLAILKGCVSEVILQLFVVLSRVIILIPSRVSRVCHATILQANNIHDFLDWWP